ncbi:hypothetical protein [Caldibacillus thermoamylovorans]|uniref:hypothetical protein n=1 Tax=Caldibacillus thermoamylovorans TaxID=35841 RepID=UPI0022E25B19|nr:hypothetical protein [Caldibacillus thermoamylovorans]
MVSSPKSEVFRLKKTTRSGLVAKILRFPSQKDDEKWSRRQKVRFFGSKRRREVVSSPKYCVFRLKTTTRSGLVAKKSSFRASKRRREVFSSPKSEVSWLKTTTRSVLVAKK